MLNRNSSFEKSFIYRYFFSGHARSVKAKKNIILSLLFNGIGIVTNIILVPIILHYLKPTKYGIWITVTSIIGWAGIADLGLGNGLRNKFAEALAKSDENLARIYVSTSYAVFLFIIVLFFSAFIITNHLIDWAKVLNVSPEMQNELRLLMFWLFTFFAIRVVSQLIYSLLTGEQRYGVNSGLSALSNIAALVVIYNLTRKPSNSLLYLGVLNGFGLTVVPFIASIWFFLKDYRRFKPSIKYVRLIYTKELLNLSLRFFLLQITGIIIFATDYIIIAQLLGPKEVTPYNIIYKYFWSIGVIFNIIISPFWSAFTEAYVKNDFVWIKTTLYRLGKLLAVFFSVILLLTILSKPVLKIWIGTGINFNFLLIISMAVFTLIFMYNTLIAVFVNGIGKISIEVITSSIGALLNIPIAIFLIKYERLGSVGVIYANIISFLISSFLITYQIWLIINKKDKGIWAA